MELPVQAKFVEWNAADQVGWLEVASGERFKAGGSYGRRAQNRRSPCVTWELVMDVRLHLAAAPRAEGVRLHGEKQDQVGSVRRAPLVQT